MTIIPAWAARAATIFFSNRHKRQEAMKKLKTVCSLLTLGRLDYEEAWKIQQAVAAARRCGDTGDTLMLVEHNHTITVGRAGSECNILVSEKTLREQGVKVIEVDRGGDVTYHGPGQIVGYPILDLRGYGQDLHRYIRLLEEVIIKTLACYGLKGYREPGLTGVWTAAGKIAAIGIGARNWVSMHGFALNVNPDMRYFGLINPCGITDRPVVSLHGLGIEAGPGEVAACLTRQFAEVFAVTYRPGRAARRLVT